MPTSSGKSLTFWLPAYIETGITIVIMPLISLIQDQIAYINSLGIKCRALLGSYSQEIT